MFRIGVLGCVGVASHMLWPLSVSASSGLGGVGGLIDFPESVRDHRPLAQSFVIVGSLIYDVATRSMPLPVFAVTANDNRVLAEGGKVEGKASTNGETGEDGGGSGKGVLPSCNEVVAPDPCQ